MCLNSENRNSANPECLYFATRKTDPASSTRSSRKGLKDNNSRLLSIVYKFCYLYIAPSAIRALNPLLIELKKLFLLSRACPYPRWFCTELLQPHSRTSALLIRQLSQPISFHSRIKMLPATCTPNHYVHCLW